MKLFYLTSLVALLSYGSADQDTAINFLEINHSEVLEKAKEEKMNVMLYFYLETCTMCDSMGKITFEDSGVATFVNDNFLAIKINTRSAEGMRANRIYQIRNHPGIIFLDSESNEVHRISGFLNPSSFLSEAKKAF